METHEKLLLNEHERIANAIHAFYMALDRAIALGLVVLGLSAAFGRGRFAVILVPVILGMIGLYALDLLREMMLLGAYKRRIEVGLNRYLNRSGELSVLPGRRITQWESWIVPGMAYRSVGKVAIWVLYLFFFICGMAASITAVLTYHGPYSGWIQIGAIVFWPVLCILAGAAIYEAWNIQYRGPDWIEWEPDELEWSKELYDRWKKDWKQRKGRPSNHLDPSGVE